MNVQNSSSQFHGNMFPFQWINSLTNLAYNFPSPTVNLATIYVTFESSLTVDQLV